MFIEKIRRISIVLLFLILSFYLQAEGRSPHLCMDAGNSVINSGSERHIIPEVGVSISIHDFCDLGILGATYLLGIKNDDSQTIEGGYTGVYLGVPFASFGRIYLEVNGVVAAGWLGIKGEDNYSDLYFVGRYGINSRLVIDSHLSFYLGSGFILSRGTGEFGGLQDDDLSGWYAQTGLRIGVQ